MAKVFGGFTAVDGYGGWIDPKTTEVVYEECLVLYAVVNPSELRWVKPNWDADLVVHTAANDLAVHLRDLFGQSTVLVTVEDLREVEFV